MSGPGVEPPPGYEILGRAGESYGPNIVAANSVTIALAIAIFLLRMGVKTFIIKQIQLDDYLIILALLGAIVRTVLMVLLVERHQLGQHMWDFEPDSLRMWYMYSNAALVVYLIAMMCTKLSILIFYIRIFGINRGFKWMCWALMTIIVGYCTAAALVTVFGCTPVRSAWDLFYPGECVSTVRLTIITGGFNIATDFLIVAFPIPLVFKLRLRPARMAGVVAILATGLFVCAVAIIRQVIIIRLRSAQYGGDQVYQAGIIDMWLSVELNIGILSVSLPILAPLGRKIPAADYFKEKYSSLISLVRERSRSKSLSQEREAYQKNDLVPVNDKGHTSGSTNGHADGCAELYGSPKISEPNGFEVMEYLQGNPTNTHEK